MHSSLSTPPSDLEHILTGFESIALDALEQVALMNRLDTKFTFGLPELPALLDRLTQHYSLLTINGVRAHRYETVYFDHPTLALYHRHHNGCYPRHKVRYRRYVDFGTCFFEIKTKRNNGRTIKQRIACPHIDNKIQGEAHRFLHQTVPRLPGELNLALRVGFTRLTLVNMGLPERLTIDLNLSYRRAESVWGLPNLVIAELKREGSTARSPFLEVMRERRIWEGSISKYCLGIIALYPEAKRNRFKERLKRVTRCAA